MKELEGKVIDFQLISSRVIELEKLCEERDSSLADLKTRVST